MPSAKLAVLAVGAATLFGYSALASDFAPLPTHKMAPGGPYCADFSRAIYHPDGDPSKIKELVQEHYVYSKKISEEQKIVYSARPTYPWADQARVYCGMAIGYFEYGEFNDEAVGKCECFYGQMIRYMQR